MNSIKNIEPSNGLYQYSKNLNIYDFDDIEKTDIYSDDEYFDVLQKLQLQCKRKIQDYQRKYHLKTDYCHLFSNSYISDLMKNEDDLIKKLNMNNPDEANLFFDYLQSLLNRNFIENRKYEIFDDCCENEYDNDALESAYNCEYDRNYLQEKLRALKNYEINIDSNEIEKKKKPKKKNYTFGFMTREPSKDIIHKNYKRYILEQKEKQKQEDAINFKFIANPCPLDILAPKYDSIVEQAKLRQKENVDSRLNMWKSILKPFSFDERDIRKQMEKQEQERLKEKEIENKNKNYNKKKIDFKLVKTAAKDGYEKYKKMKEIDNYAHMTPEHTFHPNISTEIPEIHIINSKKYKELKEKKRIEQYREEQKMIELKEKKAKQNKLFIERLKLQPTNTYKETRSSILRNRAKKEKNEIENLYNEIESEVLQDKEQKQLKMKNYIQNKLKDLNYRNYTYDKDIKGRNMNRRKEQELLEERYKEKLESMNNDINNKRTYLFEQNYEIKKEQNREKEQKELSNKNPIDKFNKIIETNGLDIDEINVYV